MYMRIKCERKSCGYLYVVSIDMSSVCLCIHIVWLMRVIDPCQCQVCMGRCVVCMLGID